MMSGLIRVTYQELVDYLLKRAEQSGRAEIVEWVKNTLAEIRMREEAKITVHRVITHHPMCEPTPVVPRAS